jgi:anti-sigma factor RsiW
MNCKQMESCAIEYLDGKLERKQAEAVARHLADCAVCAERMHAFSDVSSQLDAWEPVQPSALFNARLQQRILAEPARPAGWRDRLALWLPVNSFGRPALAGALLGLMLFAVVLERYTPATSVPASQATASTALVATTFEGPDDLTLYQDLPVLENLEFLRNFDVLQELQTTTQ